MSVPVRERQVGLFWPHLMCAAFVVLWLNVGVATSVMNALPSVVKAGILGLWLAIAAARSMPFLSRLITGGWPLGIMVLVTVLFRVEVAQSVQYTQGFAYLFIAFALWCFYSQPDFRRERHLLMGVMVLDFIVTGIRTLIAVQTDPQLARYLATTEENRTLIYGTRDFAGLGGYGFAYALGAVILLLLYFASRFRGQIWTLLPAIAVGTLALFEVAFTTAIVLTLVLAISFVVHDVVKNIGLRLFVYAAVVLGWATGLYSKMLDSIAGSDLVGADVSQRLRELARLLSGESESGSDLGTRLYYWRESIDVFLSHGPFGLAGKTAMAGDAGGHSQWLDLLAAYGILIVLPVMFFVLAWRCLTRSSSQIEVAALRRPWLFFAILGFVNTLLFSTIVLTWMFFLPALASSLAERSRSIAPEPSSMVSA